MKAKYIIHTVGPVWVYGNHHEFETLESCYAKSLQKALELGCESIAFPFIATGVYGFPKDQALQIAVTVFSRFLMENDMQIILVVFDKRSFQLSGQLVGEIGSYIDVGEIREKRVAEYSRRSYPLEPGAPLEEDVYEVCRCYSETESDETYADDHAALTLEEELASIGMSFHDKLFELIG